MVFVTSVKKKRLKQNTQMSQNGYKKSYKSSKLVIRHGKQTSLGANRHKKV